MWHVGPPAAVRAGNVLARAHEHQDVQNLHFVPQNSAETHPMTEEVEGDWGTGIKELFLKGPEKGRS